MAVQIEIRRLINFETATDGTASKVVVEDRKGRTVGIILTLETLTALLMTLPTMASKAIQRANGDSSSRLTYPLREFQIESTTDNLRILTIGTPDGLRVSFSLSEELSQRLGEAHLKGSGHRAKTH